MSQASFDSDYSGEDELWIDWFLGTKGNEYFCDIDTEFITDRFNLMGLNQEVDDLPQYLDVITDVFDSSSELEEEERDRIEEQAAHLYGLIHARYILTSRGLQKMLEKYKNCDFGRCPRVHCSLQPLLPIGLDDSPSISTVKLYCPKCEDIYCPKSTRHAHLDGAYFGTSFPAMLLQVFPHIIPHRSQERFVPKIFGFRLHEQAKIARWQEHERREMEKRLAKYAVEAKQEDENKKNREEKENVKDKSVAKEPQVKAS